MQPLGKFCPVGVLVCGRCISMKGMRRGRRGGFEVPDVVNKHHTRKCSERASAPVHSKIDSLYRTCEHRAQRQVRYVCRCWVVQEWEMEVRCVGTARALVVLGHEEASMEAASSLDSLRFRAVLRLPISV